MASNRQTEAGAAAHGCDDERCSCRLGDPNTLTDVGNAHWLVQTHGADFRYVPAWGAWLLWDDARWRRDDLGTIKELAKETVEEMHEAAAANHNRDLQGHAVASDSSARINAMVELAKTDAAVAIRPEELDADPWALNVLNGTIDLQTGELRPHRKTDLITKMAPVNFDADARSPLWDSFLAKVLPDPGVRAFMQRVAGYSLVGTSAEDIFVVVHGPTRTGKTTFVEALRAAMGEYAVASDFDAFAGGKQAGQVRNDIARLEGSRLVVCSEIEKGKAFNTALIKSVAGGDALAARLLYQEFREFNAAFTLFIACNDRPRVPHGDEAIWERAVEVPFTVHIPPDERDPKVREELTNVELSGAAVLAWMVEGCLRWQRDGLNRPAGITAASRAYRDEMDTFSYWFADHCELDAEAWTPSSALYESYVASVGPVDALDKVNFAKRLTDAGAESKKRGKDGTRGYQGVELVG